ncbi:hypothetical protein [Flavobacterium psychrotolerans]|uniref:Alpha-ketoglutarate decarboxylase n=1 Tax=Flavobacterium psychrotolerans TaxID=2169410 RepID=A0A2U1JKB2_9FLAO|nr:hypothetical protein [Flavobacterium psychrotolerans]PWA05591.1 hypothetical protein DB895_06300 [Flavobacterium psychrotolerans]
MKKIFFLAVSRSVVILTALFFSNSLIAQQHAIATNIHNDFWQKVQFGGGIGLSIGSGYTDITLVPSAIYNFNNYFSAGIGLQGSYVSSKNYYTSFHYGGSLITLFNPVEQVQLSLELEEIRVNNEYETFDGVNYQNNFWNTSLFLGGGFRSGNVTVGARYNVLYNTNKNVYNEALMPFVRVYF